MVKRPKRIRQNTGWGRLIRVSGYYTDANARKLMTAANAPLFRI